MDNDDGALGRAVRAIDEISEFQFHSRSTITELRVLHLLRQGLNGRAVAKSIGINPTVATQIAERHGIKLKRGRPPSRRGIARL